MHVSPHVKALISIDFTNRALCVHVDYFAFCNSFYSWSPQFFFVILDFFLLIIEHVFNGRDPQPYNMNDHNLRNNLLFTYDYTLVNKWNESGFRPPLCTYRLNWARRTSWGWWDDWDDTVLQTQDSKFEPWRSEAEHATSRSRRLPTILTFTRGWGRNNCFFQTAETGNRTPDSGVKGSGANHYPRAPAPWHNLYTLVYRAEICFFLAVYHHDHSLLFSTMLPCKTRQYLLTLQVSRYCLLVLQSNILLSLFV